MISLRNQKFWLHPPVMRTFCEPLWNQKLVRCAGMNYGFRFNRWTFFFNVSENLRVFNLIYPKPFPSRVATTRVAPLLISPSRKEAILLPG